MARDRLKEILSSLSHLDLEGQIINRTAHASGFGGSCDVYSAFSIRHNKTVAVKQIRVFMTKDRDFAKRLAKEIRIWITLDHENVLPLLGFTADGDHKAPSLISEWMENGTMNDYMKTFARNCLETCKMLVGIASGLAYLHSKGVIHADLKSHNVLISANKSPLLADFGLSLMLSQTQATTGTTSCIRGTVRWMAKELFQVSSEGHLKYDEATDMWAYGMIAYELLSWNVPYHDMKADHLVMLAILQGVLPAIPEETGNPRIFKGIWRFCNRCWSDKPSRPSAEESKDHFTALIWDRECLICIEDRRSLILCRNSEVK
ncbi:kinase-like protein [Schizopora paradoxa]|uniref:Kinase-like protein n=1 Tax=Schizopora paradoxa TaxID=27342 RepID=A0A0H2SB49_9AGAM|nr:kinase-like protein [Schizopora paradoxa]